MTDDTICPRCEQPANQWTRGWCRRCYNAWVRKRSRGNATDEPPLPPINRAAPGFADRARHAHEQKAAARREAYCELRADGHSPGVAAAIVGVTRSTAYQLYEPTYKARQGTAPPQAAPEKALNKALNEKTSEKKKL